MLHEIDKIEISASICDTGITLFPIDFFSMTHEYNVEVLPCFLEECMSISIYYIEVYDSSRVFGNFEFPEECTSTVIFLCESLWHRDMYMCMNMRL